MWTQLNRRLKKNGPLTFNIHHGHDIYDIYPSFGQIKLNLVIYDSIIIAIDCIDVFCVQFY